MLNSPAPQSDRRDAPVRSNRSWILALKTAYHQAQEDRVGLVAAGVAFYAFLALVPLLAALVIIYGLIADPATIANHADRLTDFLPASAAQLVSDQLDEIVGSSSSNAGIGLAAALVFAIFSARGAMRAIIVALNLAYAVDDGRGFLTRNLVALALTSGMALGILLAAGAVGVTAILPGWGSAVAGYAVVFAATVGGALLVYRYAPDRPPPSPRLHLPGAVLCGTLGTVLTIGFGFYAANFGNYNATYGALGAIVVLLMWFYLMAYSLLLGAELNAPVEHDADDDRFSS